jgi:hypothetical protein
LNLGPPPDTTPATPNLGAPPVAPGIAALPPAAEPRRVGIHAEGPKAADDPSHVAAYEADKVGETAGKTGPSASPPAAGGEGSETAKKMWAPLFGSLLALFASVGGNVFLGWTAVNMRGRYKALLAHQQLV